MVCVAASLSAKAACPPSREIYPHIRLRALIGRRRTAHDGGLKSSLSWRAGFEYSDDAKHHEAALEPSLMTNPRVPMSDSPEGKPRHGIPTTGCNRGGAMFRALTSALVQSVWVGAAAGVALLAATWHADSNAGSHESAAASSSPSSGENRGGATACISAEPLSRPACPRMPVASQELLDETGGAHDDGSASRFDEQCRPLPSVAGDAGVDAAPASSPSGDLAPTPAPPQLAQREPHRYVLMVEVEAQHGSNARE
jgi:hypothetical protein